MLSNRRGVIAATGVNLESRVAREFHSQGHDTARSGGSQMRNATSHRQRAGYTPSDRACTTHPRRGSSVTNWSSRLLRDLPGGYDDWVISLRRLDNQRLVSDVLRLTWPLPWLVDDISRKKKKHGKPPQGFAVCGSYPCSAALILPAAAVSFTSNPMRGKCRIRCNITRNTSAV